MVSVGDPLSCKSEQMQMQNIKKEEKKYCHTGKNETLIQINKNRLRGFKYAELSALLLWSQLGLVQLGSGKHFNKHNVLNVSSVFCNTVSHEQPITAVERDLTLPKGRGR